MIVTHDFLTWFIPCTDIVLVLATGSKWTGPIDYPENDSDIRQFISQWQERFKSAEDVVIVGGGAVGLGTYCRSSLLYPLTDTVRFVEIAGEVRDEYPVSVPSDFFTLGNTMLTRYRRRRRSLSSIPAISSSTMPTQTSSVMSWRPRCMRGASTSF